MEKSKVALIIAISTVAAAGGALLVSQQLRASRSPKDPLDEAQAMIGECYQKISEIQGKLGTRNIPEPA